MVKTSTLFFIFHNLNQKHELYLPEKLLDPGEVEDEIVREYLEGIEYEPGENVLENIFQAAKI